VVVDYYGFILALEDAGMCAGWHLWISLCTTQLPPSSQRRAKGQSWKLEIYELTHGSGRPRWSSG
jgi:hypothetical protein